MHPSQASLQALVLTLLETTPALAGGFAASVPFKRNLTGTLRTPFFTPGATFQEHALQFIGVWFWEQNSRQSMIRASARAAHLNRFDSI
jgi:hypothetical protein